MTFYQDQRKICVKKKRVSKNIKKMKKIENIVKEANNNKVIFTAGPASLVDTNLSNLKPCFGEVIKNI